MSLPEVNESVSLSPVDTFTRFYMSDHVCVRENEIGVLWVHESSLWGIFLFYFLCAYVCLYVHVHIIDMNVSVFKVGERVS